MLGNSHNSHSFLCTGNAMIVISMLDSGCIGKAWEVKGRMAAVALSTPLAHWIPGAGARLAELAAKAKNNPTAVVGQGRVTGRACRTGGSGFSGCHQRGVITSELIISGHM